MLWPHWSLPSALSSWKIRSLYYKMLDWPEYTEKYTRFSLKGQKWFYTVLVPEVSLSKQSNTRTILMLGSIPLDLLFKSKLLLSIFTIIKRNLASGLSRLLLGPTGTASCPLFHASSAPLRPESDHIYDVEIATVFLAVWGQNEVGRVRHNITVSWFFCAFISTQKVHNCSCCNCGSWPQGINGNSLIFELLSHSQDTHWHAVFGNSVCDMVSEPSWAHVERRWDVENMRVLCLEKMRQTILGNHESSPDIDLMHQVILFHGLVNASNQVNSWGIIDEDIDPSECVYHLLDALLNTLFTSDITLERKGLSSFVFDLFGSCVNGPWKSWLRLDCLSKDGNIGSILGTSESDSQSNPPGSSSDDNSFSLKRLVGYLLSNDVEPVHILWRNRYDLN